MAVKTHTERERERERERRNCCWKVRLTIEMIHVVSPGVIQIRGMGVGRCMYSLE